MHPRGDLWDRTRPICAVCSVHVSNSSMFEFTLKVVQTRLCARWSGPQIKKYKLTLRFNKNTWCGAHQSIININEEIKSVFRRNAYYDPWRHNVCQVTCILADKDLSPFIKKSDLTCSLCITFNLYFQSEMLSLTSLQHLNVTDTFRIQTLTLVNN